MAIHLAHGLTTRYPDMKQNNDNGKRKRGEEVHPTDLRFYFPLNNMVVLKMNTFGSQVGCDYFNS